MRKSKKPIAVVALVLVLAAAIGAALAARSASEETVVVPDVVGMTLTDATTRLTRAGFAWKLSSRDETHTEPIQPRTDGGMVSPTADDVTAQEPSAGSEAEAGETIELKTRCSDVACQ